MGGLLAGSEMRYSVNGLLSLTPDAQQVLGETAEVEKLWSAAAVWVKEGPGTARLIAEWITHGYPRLCDPHGSDVTRFYPHERTLRHIRQRCREHFNKTYGIVHPREQWASGRGMNRAPFHDRTAALGAELYEARGWERPQWYASNADLVERYGVADRPPRMGPPLVVADHQCRAPALAREGGRRRSERVPGLRRGRPRRRGLPRTARRQPLRRARRPLDLHAAADAGGRHPRRSHHPAARGRPLPHRDRCLRRGARRGLVPPAPARRRLGAAREPVFRAVHDRRVGARRPRAALDPDRRPPLAGRLPLRHRAGGHPRRGAGDPAAHLLRGRERLGDLRRHAVRRPPVGRDHGGGPRLRRPFPWASASTAPPAGWRRATR